jgi:ATP-dependent Zn protease
MNSRNKGQITDIELRRTAFHEAAHAVILAVCQLRFSTVFIQRTPRERRKHGMPGRLVQVHESMMFNIREAAGSCVSSFASMAAERLVDPRLTYRLLSLSTCVSDCDGASEACSRFGIDERRVIATATHLVRLNRAVIRTVAQALLEDGELTYGQVMAVVDPFSPTACRSRLLVDRLWE